MRVHRVDVLVVGGGAAGMAAAVGSAAAGARTLLVEHGPRLGGVLDQCIHPGFGLHRYREELTGPEFAHRLEGELRGVEVWTGWTLLALDPTRPRARGVGEGGLGEVRAQAVVWAAGARERPWGALRIPGTRPAGIFVAGLAQRLVNIHGLLPGKRALVLGSGDIGLIMARRLHLEGMEVVAVAELRPFPGGLLRNVVQCLDDFGIPLWLETTVVEVHGRTRLEGVTVAGVDETGRPRPQTARFVPLDTLVLSVGLIPEVEGVPFAPRNPTTGGLAVSARLQTAVPWLFGAGNCLAPFDLVDTVAALGEQAGVAAARYARGELPPRRATPVRAGRGVATLVPSSVVPGAPATLYLRASLPLPAARVEVGPGIVRRTVRGVRPAEMLTLALSAEETQAVAGLDEVLAEVIPLR
ncbi:MAG TPA: FAD-dependent oxidoreductase [Candidatus Acetothermia bacterium]|nr:FAD-dependent oxidoreductase [Candidatus Acetothermia bacterium]